MRNFILQAIRPAKTLLLLSLFVSCQKDKIIGPNPDLTPYRISKIKLIPSLEQSLDSIIYTFTYNRFGEPLTVRNTAVRTGNPNVVFKYDKLGRLLYMVRPYENQSYESLDKYYYNEHNQIALDSQYNFGTYIDSVPTATMGRGFYVRRFKYDALNRVTERTDSFFLGGGRSYGNTRTFQYDQAGNLITGAAYDHKLNYRRTNVVWMFLTNDYSVNNAFIADTYSQFGLPLAWDTEDLLGTVVQGPGRVIISYESE
ncbi:MAG: RHS repeat domain-containing protein [Bacteroidota bacterium]|nr:RHS repeat domain-containing protein [Bacteroidota bacterium]MDP4218703.1 RHS repeat domain-containing protein [Bacteroidota bacterium]MDP4257431.1 RHS repeat domain-containing protein [Bacteroidota bacterium]